MHLLENTFAKGSSYLSKLKISSETHTNEDIEGFKKAQRLAYECATSIAKELKEGWTELQTAKLMDTYLKDYGVKAFFHKSFAWFGDRTRFQDFTHNWHFMPSKRQLTSSDVVILDTAPIVNGFTADIGYTCSLKPSSVLKRAQQDLLEFRKNILEYFKSNLTTAEIWEKVDQDFKAKGYDNCHLQYPFGVLGHKLHKIPFSHLPSITIPFGLHSFWALLSRGLFPELLSKHHNGSKDGLWAIEPHLGANGFGAKFEEILVVQKGNVYWLDEEVPHVKNLL